MATLRSLAEELALGAGVDGQLAVELYKERILHFRQLILVREYNKTRRFYPSAIQAFDIGLTKINKAGGTMFMSEVLPKPLLVDSRSPFISVSTTRLDDKRRSFDYISIEEIEFLQYRKFSKPANYYTYENDRLYSFTKDKLRVRGAFDNPILVREFSTNEDVRIDCKDITLESSCFIDDDIYLEESLAAAIMTFMNPTSSRRNVQSRRTPEREEDGRESDV